MQSINDELDYAEIRSHLEDRLQIIRQNLLMANDEDCCIDCGCNTSKQLPGTQLWITNYNDACTTTFECLDCCEGENYVEEIDATWGSRVLTTQWKDYC